jgi:hypothetical protein
LRSQINKKNDGIYAKSGLIFKKKRSKNNWILNETGEIIPYVPKDKFSPKTEVYASISSMGIAGPVFVDGKINSEVYMEKVLPIIALQITKRKTKTNDPTTTRMISNTRRFVFQQDLAPSHRSKVTQRFLKLNLGNNFLKKDDTPPAFVEWPIECFWNVIKKEVYSKGKPKDMRQLKRRIRKAFIDFDFDWLKNTFNSMPDRINAIIAAEGGHTRY